MIIAILQIATAGMLYALPASGRRYGLFRCAAFTGAVGVSSLSVAHTVSTRVFYDMNNTPSAPVKVH